MNRNTPFFHPYHPQRTLNASNPDSETSTVLFKKYAPKYLKKISQIYKDGSIISKLKRTKIVRNLVTLEHLWPSKYWRSFLSNKAKTVKTLHSPEKFSHQFPQKIKFLPKLTSIQISMPKTSAMQFQKLDKKLESSLKRTFRTLRFQRNLKSLEISQLSTNYADFLLRLNLNKKLLNSLENLSLSCQEKGNAFPDACLLYEMLNNYPLAKQVTSLDLGTLCYTWHYMNFKYLAKSVPNLSRLSFGFLHLNGLSKSIGNYLETCKNFEKIKSLEVNIANTFVFVKDFVAPAGIRHLKFSFHEGLSKDIMLKFDKDFAEIEDDALRIFQENEVFSGFSAKLQQLNQLKALEIVWGSGSDPQAHKYQVYFTQCLLRRVKNLESFSCSSSEKSERKALQKIVKDPYLPQILESSLHLNQTLEALEIGNRNIEFTKFDLFGLKDKFDKLSSIKIAGEFSSSHENIGPFLHQLICLGSSLTKIKLEVFGIKNPTALISLLKQLKKLDLSRKVNIELQVKLEADSNLNWNHDGVKSMDKEHSAVKQQVSLKLRTKVISKEMKKFLRLFGEQFKCFEMLGR